MNKHIFILLLLFACTTKKNNELIELNFSKDQVEIKQEEIDCRYIPLETTAASLISSISNVKIHNSRIYLLEGTQNKKLLVFDLNGKYITQIGGLGMGPGEYISPLSFHIDEEKQALLIADGGKNRLLRYHLYTYEYISSQPTGNFSECAWLANGDIAWYKKSGFDTGKRKKFYLKITDDQLEQKELYNESPFNSGYGISVGNNFYSYENNLFIHFCYSPVIWKVSSQEIIPVYEIIFGNAQLPPLDLLKRLTSNKMSDYTKELYKSEYVVEYTLHENSSYFCVLYVKKNTFYIGFYDKNTESGWSTPLYDFINATGLVGFGNICGTHDDFFISYLYANSLKKRSILREDLRVIADQVKEEDNPVLCLFNIKQ